MSSQRTEVIYGLHAVRALLTRHPERVAHVYLQQGRHDARADEIEQLARAAGRDVSRVDARQLQARLGEAVHQGIVAEVAPLAAWSEEQLLEAVTASAQPLLLALDGVQDPHNLGACLRTADACGALAVVVPKDRAANLSPVVRKVAAGAAEYVPLVTVTNLVRTLRLLKHAQLWVTGADAAAAAHQHLIDKRTGNRQSGTSIGRGLPRSLELARGCGKCKPGAEGDAAGEAPARREAARPERLALEQQRALVRPELDALADLPGLQRLTERGQPQAADLPADKARAAGQAHDARELHGRVGIKDVLLGQPLEEARLRGERLREAGGAAGSPAVELAGGRGREQRVRTGTD